MSLIIRHSHFFDHATFQLKLIHQHNFFENCIDILSFLIGEFLIDNIVSIVVLLYEVTCEILHRQMIIVFLRESDKLFLTSILIKLPVENKKSDIGVWAFLHPHPLSQQMQMHRHEISTDVRVLFQKRKFLQRVTIED